MTQAAVDAKRLDSVIGTCKSIRQVGRVIYGLTDTAASVSGEMMESRVYPALEWRRARGCQYSNKLLARRKRSQGIQINTAFGSN